MTAEMTAAAAAALNPAPLSQVKRPRRRHGIQNGILKTHSHYGQRNGNKRSCRRTRRTNRNVTRMTFYRKQRTVKLFWVAAHSMALKYSRRLYSEKKTGCFDKYSQKIPQVLKAF